MHKFYYNAYYNASRGLCGEPMAAQRKTCHALDSGNRLDFKRVEVVKYSGAKLLDDHAVMAIHCNG